jgi:ankyrin repeat protein
MTSAIAAGGADLEFNNTHDGFTPLAAAAKFGHAEAVTMLLERGADVDGE